MNNKGIKKVDTNKNISLSVKEEFEAFSEGIISYVTGAIGSLIPLAGFLVSWDKERKDIKQRKIIECLKSEVSLNTKNIASISNLLKKYRGLVLYHKVISLTNHIEIEDEYFDHFIKLLAKVLVNISYTDFEKSFQKHNYVLSKIERLTPQELRILSDHEKWPGNIDYSSSTSSGVTTGAGWNMSFTKRYVASKKITDPFVEERISHTLYDLMNNNIISQGPSSLPLTKIGAEILEYLK